MAGVNIQLWEFGMVLLNNILYGDYDIRFHFPFVPSSHLFCIDDIGNLNEVRYASIRQIAVGYRPGALVRSS